MKGHRHSKGMPLQAVATFACPEEARPRMAVLSLADWRSLIMVDGAVYAILTDQ